MHLNIQSILPKLDLIKCESPAYDVLVFSESWLKPVTANDKLLIEAFHPPFRADRIGRPGGGVIIYVRQSLTCKRQTDLERTSDTLIGYLPIFQMLPKTSLCIRDHWYPFE